MSSSPYQAGLTYRHDVSLDDALQGRATQIEQGNLPPLQDEPTLQGRIDNGPTWRDRVATVGKALARAASALDVQLGGSTGTSFRANLDDLTYQPTNITSAKHTTTPVTNRELKLQTLQSYTDDAMAKVDEQRVQIGQKAVQNLHRNVVNVLDQLSQAQGLPTYREWHAQNGIAYTLPPDPGTLGLTQIQNQQNTSNYRVQEDRQKIQANLQHGQKPLKFENWQNAQQKATPQEQDNLLAGFKNNPASQPQLTASATASSKTQSKTSSAWHNLQSGAVLDDSELKNVFHAIDIRYYGAATEQDKRQAELLRLYAEQKQAENTVNQAERDEDGNVLLAGVPVRPADALYFARLDVHHFQQTDTHLKPNQILATTQIKPKQTLNKKQTDKLANSISQLPKEVQFHIKRQPNLLRGHVAEKNIRPLISKEIELFNHLNSKYYLYTANGGKTRNRLDWYDLVNIVDYIAKNTHSDEEFRVQLWLLFGTKIDASLNQFVDANNTRLPKKYHNTGYNQEQFHHYLGGVTGDLENSHFNNNWFGANANEVSELFKRQAWNQGDVDLFLDTQKHRDDFLKYGRYSVAPNLQELLIQKRK